MTNEEYEKKLKDLKASRDLCIQCYPSHREDFEKLFQADYAALNNRYTQENGSTRAMTYSFEGCTCEMCRRNREGDQRGQAQFYLKAAETIHKAEAKRKAEDAAAQWWNGLVKVASERKVAEVAAEAKAAIYRNDPVLNWLRKTKVVPNCPGVLGFLTHRRKRELDL